jgi:hypothetical protein
MVMNLPDWNDEPEAQAWSPPPAIAAARGLLKPPVPMSVSIWTLFGAAALFAGSALALAFAVVWGPPQLF